LLAASIAGGGTFSLAASDAFFVGEGYNASSPSSLSSAGDVDGDGLDDLLIGSKSNMEGGGMSNFGWPDGAGKAYLVLSPY